MDKIPASATQEDLPFAPGASQLRLSRPSRVSHTVTRLQRYQRLLWLARQAAGDTYQLASGADLMESRGLSQDPAQDLPDLLDSCWKTTHFWLLEVRKCSKHRGDAFVPKSLLSALQIALGVWSILIRRDMSDMPMSSPPRVSSTPSDFMACSGIVKPESKGYYSFPESGHFTTALSFVNSSLAENLANTSKTGGSNSLVSDLPLTQGCRSKDFEIHGSSLGMSAPACDRAFSSLLGSKPLDGLRLSQASYVKSENNLRCLTFVLETAEHFFVSSWVSFKGQREEFQI
ncbi:Hypothetical predicted protein [Mytilus galloprovincialis]|uniref:Uncharacterized protein n=1 Tax=Mytilus galloprovincialis TaxID=29158 RepID=A0A8B6GRZ4_MYTGA|nr:Hypothetical predicted protein [Mytilus galloprovincialis]